MDGPDAPINGPGGDNGPRTALSRIGGFSVSVAMATVLGIVSLSMLNLLVGEYQWGRLVFVQTVGLLVGIFVAFGWGATGAAMVAGTPASGRSALFRDSLRIRFILYLVAAPIAAVVLVALLHGDLAVGVTGAVVYLLPSLGGAWYFTGEGAPLRLILFDTLPSMMGTILGLALTWWSRDIWMFLVGQGIGYLTAVLTTAVVILRTSPAPAPTPAPAPRPKVIAALGAQKHAAFATFASSLYVSLPLIAIQLFMPLSLSLYAIADRLFRYAAVAIQPIQQFFQSWVPASREDLASRARFSALVGASVGLFGGCAVAVLSPWISPLLTAGNLEVPFSLSIPLGVAFVGIGTSAIVGYAGLIPLKQVRTLAASTMLGSLLGAPLILVFALLGSTPLVAWAVAISEVSVAVWQTIVLFGTLRKIDRQ